MKIAFFSDTYLPTINGISYAIRNWKTELESRGHDATIVCPAPGHDEDDVTFRSVGFPFYQGFRASVFPPVKHDFSDYDMIHLNSFFGAGLYGMYVAKKNGIPVVSTVHTPIEEYLDYVTESTVFQKFAHAIYDEWETYMLNKSEFCIVPTDSVREDIADKVHRDIKTLPNGVDIDFFQQTDDSGFRDRYDIHDDRVIGYTGRIGKEKRLEELIALAGDFDGQIVIGGDGPMRDQYEIMASDYDNVTFLGFLDRDELPELYSCLDLVIFPSRVETEGLVSLEASACGTPVIGADAAALKESIEEGVNGYRYEPGNITDLQETVQQAYQDLDRLQATARQKAVQKSLTNTADMMLEYYREAIQRFQTQQEERVIDLQRLKRPRPLRRLS